MFDPVTETGDDWDKEIKEDCEEEGRHTSLFFSPSLSGIMLSGIIFLSLTSYLSDISSFYP
jgi:hypothetical protein